MEKISASIPFRSRGGAEVDFARETHDRVRSKATEGGEGALH